MDCWSNLDAEAEAFSLFRMSMKIESGEAPPVLHWHNHFGHGLDRNFIDSPHIELKAMGHGGDGCLIYEADLSSHLEWRGRIQRLMLQPARGKNAQFRIDWIELRPDRQ